tara:strand:- start:14 stop:967 length:954 start_codon:yes stop_codon:yes gene_type:complete
MKKKITLKESSLTNLIKRVVLKEQKKVLTEAIACHVTDNPCKVGNCLFDPGTNSMCCVKDISYGCMDSEMAYDHDDKRKTRGIGSGSGFKKPQGGSDRLEKFNRRQRNENIREKRSLLTEAPFACPANPLSFQLAPGWKMEVQLQPSMWFDISGNGTMFNIDFASGKYMCKLTYTFHELEPDAPRTEKDKLSTISTRDPRHSGDLKREPQDDMTKTKEKDNVRLKESELINLIKRVVKEQDTPELKLPLGTFATDPFAGEEPRSEIKPSMTKPEFLKQLDDLCSEINSKEKMVGNRSCSRCHKEVMELVRYYCSSVN